jgi:hypothetical protein
MADGDPIRKWILEEGGASRITRISSVGGGCINTANRYETDVGSFFVKTNRNIGPEMFEAEAAGLDAMFSTDTIRVPKPWKVSEWAFMCFVMCFCLYATVIYCSALQLMMALGSILFVLSMPDPISPIELVCGLKSAGWTLCPQVCTPLLIATCLPHMHAHGF